MRFVGENIRLWRTLQGMSQAELAARVRIRGKLTTQSYISQVERGKIEPSVRMVVSVARVFGCYSWQLLVPSYHAQEFFSTYISLTPSQKREVIRLMKLLKKRGTSTLN